MRRDQRGFTLVEVIIVSAILLLVIAGVYSFFTFGQRVFRSGSGQADLHASVRLAAEKISRELRFAGEVELLEENWDPASASTDEHSYIYYDSNNLCLMLLDSTGARAISSPIISNVIFSADPEEGKILLFTIQGEEGSAVFALDSSVRPMNLSNNIAGAGNAPALRFSMPPDLSP